MPLSPPPKSVLITGAAGGIGQALVSEFLAAGWNVIATDHPSVCPPPVSPLSTLHSPLPHWLPLDLAAFVHDEPTRTTFAATVRSLLSTFSPPSPLPSSSPLSPLPSQPSAAPSTLHSPLALTALINNAAVQRLGTTAAITLADWNLTLAVNLTAPLLLTQTFLPELEVAKGSVVNIASIHAQLTKPGFVSYASSKAALAGLTRALAVDLGGRVRVNAICPAAISTPMLEAGFAGRTEARRNLDAYHPAGQIGQPAEIAQIARLLTNDSWGFLTGCSINLDGAISSRLHDPA